MIDRILSLVGLGRIRLIDDSGPVQRIQVDQGAFVGARRITDNVPLANHYGFGSVPPIDTEVLVVRMGGDRSQSVAIATNHQPSRPRDLHDGDVVIYDTRGARILLTEAGIFVDAAGADIEVTNADTVSVTAKNVTVIADKVRVEADLLEVTGDIVSRAEGERVSLNALRDAYQAHKHGGVVAGNTVTGATDKPA